MTDEPQNPDTDDDEAPTKRPQGWLQGPIRTRWILATALLLATLGTTTLTGLEFADVGKAASGEPYTLWEVMQLPQAWTQALLYSLSIMGILLVHELGHYIPARRYGVEATLPYFLPGFPPFGTFGAFIRMALGPISPARLFRIGAGGPFAGFVVAVPLFVIGLWLSEVKPVPPELEGAHLGDSIITWGLARLMFGELPLGHDVFLHPMAYAGWVGLFVTAFNLVPLGQLDGGHIGYTLLGSWFNRAAPHGLVALVVLGVVIFPGWLVLSAFLFFMGPRHPEVTNGETLRGADRVWGWLGLLLFVLTFVPRPFEVPSILDLLWP